MRVMTMMLLAKQRLMMTSSWLSKPSDIHGTVAEFPSCTTWCGDVLRCVAFLARG
jgi:hypothetical protein